MKTKLLIFNLLFSCFLIAQTAEERDKMLKTYDLQKVNSLIEKLKIGEIEKEQMLEEYLASNPDVRENIMKMASITFYNGIQEINLFIYLLIIVNLQSQQNYSSPLTLEVI